MQLSEAEWRVMSPVWAKGEASARDVLEALSPGTEWAYTTLKTMMDRLVEKGALRARKRGNVTLYEPALSRVAATKSALRALVDRAFGGAFPPLVRFLVDEVDEKQGKLSAADGETLRSLLEADSKRHARKPR